MAQAFKETAHLKTDIKKLHEGFDRIKIFSDFQKQIELSVQLNDSDSINRLMMKLEEILDFDAVEKMASILNIPLPKKEAP